MDFPIESWLDLTLLSCWVIGLTCGGWWIGKMIKKVWTMNWKSQLLSKQELDFIKESGYTIRVKWISPAEGFEYRISLMGDEEVLAYRKSARAAFNFIMRLKRRG